MLAARGAARLWSFVLANPHRRRWIFPAILCLAFALRFYALGEKSLWGDELDTLRITEKPNASELIRSLYYYNRWTYVNPPIYFLGVHYVSRLSDSEAALRLLSAIAGVMAVAAFYGLSRTLVPRRHAWMMTLLFATSPLAVHYSQENRPYSFFLFESILAAWGLAAFVKYGRPWALALFIMGLVLALYTSYVAMLLSGCLFAGAGIALLWKMREPAFRRRSLRRLLLLAGAGMVVLIAYIPWLKPARDFFLQNSQTIDSGLVALENRFQFSDAAALWSNLLSLPDALKFLPVLLLALYIAALARRRRVKESWLVLSICLLPVIALLIFRPGHYHYRHLIFIFPFLLIAAYRATILGGWTRIQAVPALVAAAWIAFWCYGLADYYRHEKEDWRTAVAYLEDHVREGDAIITGMFFVEDALAYYHRRNVPNVRILTNVGLAGPDKPPPVEDFIRASASSPRVWYVTSFHHLLPPWVHEILRHNYRVQAVIPGKLPIYLYLKDDANPVPRNSG